MLIAQIIEFELRGLEPLSSTCTPTTGYFYDKTKMCYKNRGILLFIDGQVNAKH